MDKLKNITQAVIHSLPVQLFLIQIKKYKLLLIFWLILLGILSGSIGTDLGLSYLFLEPEYLDKEGFWSLFIVGTTLGTFLFAYMITMFINESYRFHFIAMSRQPFLTFSFNNALLPALLLGIYFNRFIAFHISTNDGFTFLVAEKVLGLVTGMGVTFLLFASYFFAMGRRNILSTLSESLERELDKARGGANRKLIIDKAKESYRSSHRVDLYLDLPFQVNRVESHPANFRALVQILNKNHGNLLLLQIGIFIVISVLGLMEENRYFQIPAGASVLLVFSLILMIAGAITFWFRKLGILPLIVLALFLVLYNQKGFLHESHHAMGMNYGVEPAAYTQENLGSLYDEDVFASDRKLTLEMLENWKEGYQKKYGAHMKPKAVFVSSSGGGLRSSFWNMLVLHQLDSITGGIFTDNVRLYTGASGGAIGSAYFRELALRRHLGEIPSFHEEAYRRHISKDLLNRISFRLFTDIFLPNTQVQVGSHWYDRERGYSFDHQMGLNLPELRDRRLGDYAAYEQQGIIAPLVLTPTITNQGRKLYISSSPASFLARGKEITGRYTSKASGVEFRRMFAAQDADSLRMTTALRMNATFPFVLPVVELPSTPPMLVMDAGAIDNYGIETAVRYLFEFREWFAQNTNGVIFVQIRDNGRVDPIFDDSKEGFINRIFTPLGGGYKSMIESRDMAYDQMLEVVEEWFEGPVEVVSFEYPMETSDRPASISFHLTSREKRSIQSSLSTTHNQSGFATIQKMYHQDILLAAQYRQLASREVLGNKGR